MAHNHKLPDGQETGQEIIDADNPRRHWHMLKGDKTSSTEFGPNHVHTINNTVTGPPIEIRGKEMNQELKYHGGVITKFHHEERPEGQFGIVEGYIATWDIDRGDMFGLKDQFVPGAFKTSIADHLQRDRDIRFKDHHKRTVGVWKIDTVHEDERGLFGRAEINLDLQQGRDVFSLIKQGALSDFSIGFSVNKNGSTTEGDLRTINSATIWEGSIVDEPMNPHANVTGFKAVVPFQDLPLADRDTPWDATMALQRVKEFTDSEEAPTIEYKRAFLRFDRDNTNVFSGYKLPIADIIDGKLTVIPKGIFEAATNVKESEGVDLPESDKPGVIRHLERYYAKMDLPSPFVNERQFILVDDIRGMPVRDLEKLLIGTGVFSKNAVKLLISKISKKPTVDKPYDSMDNQKLKQLIDDINELKNR